MTSRWKPGVDFKNDARIMEASLLTGISAGMSGTIVALIMTPVDVVKTRLMLNANNIKSEAATFRAFSIGRDIFRRDGIKGLFRGGAIRAVWTAISMSIYLSMYEGMKLSLQHRQDSHHRAT